MGKIALFVFCGLSFLIQSYQVDAYNIHLKGKHHERMAWLSEKCWKDQGLAKKCHFPESADEFKAISGKEFRQGAYWEAVRWSDDPTRQLKSVFTWPKFAIVVQFRCPKLVTQQGFFAGLSCGSHHGQMQFMHSMASSQNETSAETKQLIRGWSKYAFRIATGQIELNDNYCQTATENADQAANKLAPEGLSYCEDREVNGTHFDAWTARTLFAFHCDKMFSSVSCDVLENDADKEIARIAAIGALLHLIQDSFSQSHAMRGPIGDGKLYDSKIECLPVQRFYYYGDNKDTHSSADKAPNTSDSCALSATILDPVTAGARLLYFVDQGPEAEEAALKLIMNSVIG